MWRGTHEQNGIMQLHSSGIAVRSCSPFRFGHIFYFAPFVGNGGPDRPAPWRFEQTRINKQIGGNMLTQEALKIKAMVANVKPEQWPTLEPPTVQLIAGMYPQYFQEDSLWADPATGAVIHRLVIPQLTQAALIAGLRANKVIK
jgi:hypothetical protein